MSEIIDDVLAGLVTARQTINKQTSKIGEIMEKSNNTLLHVEAQNKAETPTTTKTTLTSPTDEQKVFNFKPDNELTIVKILEQFQQFLQQTVDGGDNNTGGYMEACQAYNQRVEYLGSSVRKLVALCDTIAQMKLDMQRQQLISEEEKENTDDEY